jgi:hypothetical protein
MTGESGGKNIFPRPRWESTKKIKKYCKKVAIKSSGLRLQKLQVDRRFKQ